MGSLFGGEQVFPAIIISNYHFESHHGGNFTKKLRLYIIDCIGCTMSHVDTLIGVGSNHNWPHTRRLIFYLHRVSLIVRSLYIAL